MSAADIKTAALTQLEQIAQTLIPTFRKVGNNLVVGDLAGTSGSSLKLNLSGRNAGLWRDWAANSDGRSHSIVDLVMQVKNLSYVQALQWLADFTGTTYQKNSETKLHPYTPPKQEKLVELSLESKVGNWIQNERKIPVAIASDYGVFSDTKDLAAVMAHYIGIEACMMKAFWGPWAGKKGKCITNENPLHVLFGKPKVTPETPSRLPSGSILITEGQWDALSYVTAGIPAVSIPSGVDNLQWIDNDWEYLMQFDTYYISFDMDEPGRRCAHNVAMRLGLERCRDVKLPMKDANEMLVAGRVDELLEAVDEAVEFTPDFLTSAGSYRDKVKDILAGNNLLSGEAYIWNDFPMRVRQHEFTVYTGYAGHGKSTLAQQLMSFITGKGQRSCIASIESPPESTLAVMTLQICGGFDPRKPKIFELGFQYLVEHVDIYDNKNEKADVDRMLELFTYAYKRHGVTQFVIDNVMCLNISRSDYDAQSYAADKVRAFVRMYPVHVHVIAHPRKPETKTGTHPPPPSIHEVRGASEWCDMAQNVIAIWRNLAKIDHLNDAKEQGSDISVLKEIQIGEPDAKISVHKQRETGKLGTMPFWFDDKTKRFLLTHGEIQHPYVGL